MVKIYRHSLCYTVMRITTLLIGIQACFTAVLLAGTITDAQTINLDVQQASVKQVFVNIEKQANVTFVYNEKTIQGLDNISLKANNKPLAEVLKSISEQVPLLFKQAGAVIGVSKLDLKSQPKELIPGQRNSLDSFPPPLKISGKITNENGEPLAGVSVRLSQDKATVSDINGVFSIMVPNEKSQLIFSYVGYKTQGIIVGTQETLIIVMSLDLSNLDEVQIIAYGTTTQRLNTGNTSKVTAETIEQQPVSNPLEALEGQVAGLDIVQKNGMAGGGVTVRIRGQNSIAAGNDPLYIIDGVPYFSETPSTSNLGAVLNGSSPLNFINPSDIESIEILKDADATAIYGSRGANGVILITTKRGKVGKTNLNVNLYGGVSDVTRMMDLLNTQQYLQMRHEAFKNDGKTPGASDYDINGTWDTTRYTNWEKLMIGNTGHTEDAQLSLSGGDTNTQFLLGGGYHKETSVFPGNLADQKGSVHFNVAHTSDNKKLKINFSGSYLSDQNNLIQSDLTSTALKLAPDSPAPYDANGNLNWAGGTFQNPLSVLLLTYQMSTANLISNGVLSYQVIKGLQIKTSLGFNSIQINEQTESPASSINPAFGVTTGSASFASTSVNSWIIEPQAVYEKTLGHGKLNTLIGTTFEQSITNGQRYNGSGYTNSNLLGTISGAATITSSTPNYIQYRYDAVFARINYDWDEKYIIDLTGRRDGSSRFGPGKQFANFGALGGAWIFSNEKTIKDVLPFLSYGKLRASYGITGNDQIADYGYINTYGSTTYPYGGTSGLVPTKLLNPDYSWEINKKFELGFELGFLKDHILLTASYYNNRSSNELVGYALPSITGFTSIQYNLPATVQNTGLEFDIKTNNVNSGVFKWTTSKE